VLREVWAERREWWGERVLIRDKVRSDVTTLIPD
jgi:hypothetical protein